MGGGVVGVVVVLFEGKGRVFGGGVDYYYARQGLLLISIQDREVLFINNQRESYL